MASTKVIRDFLYVDAERLDSLYSQVFEGVAENIVRSYMSELSSQERAEGAPSSGAGTESHVAETSSRTESRVLYDHMYNQLEDRISPALVLGSDVTEENYQELLRDRFMVKVSGAVEIEDFQRIAEIMEQYNRIGEAIAYSALVSQGVNELLEQLKSGQGKDRNQKTRDRKKAERLNASNLAKQMGLQQDEKNLENLRMMTEFFNRDSYEVLVNPGSGVWFRGVLDTRWLRMSRRLLRSLYGVAPGGEWIMVGQVTFVPGMGSDAAVANGLEDLLETDEESVEVDLNEGESAEAPSMRDPIRGLFRTSRPLENMFLESRAGTEIVMIPLAIYRQFTIGAKEDSG